MADRPRWRSLSATLVAAPGRVLMMTRTGPAGGVCSAASRLDGWTTGCCADNTIAAEQSTIATSAARRPRDFKSDILSVPLGA